MCTDICCVVTCMRMHMYMHAPAFGRCPLVLIHILPGPGVLSLDDLTVNTNLVNRKLNQFTVRQTINQTIYGLGHFYLRKTFPGNVFRKTFLGNVFWVTFPETFSGNVFRKTVPGNGSRNVSGKRVPESVSWKHVLESVY